MIVAAIGSGLALMFRQRRPAFVLAATTVCYAVQVTLGGPVVPAASAVASESVARTAAAAGDGLPRARGLASVGVGLIVTAASLAISGNGFLAAPFGLLLLAAALVGQFRCTRAIHETARRHQMIVAERLRLARDLHDVVGHGIGAITVQAGAARLAVAAGDTTGPRRMAGRCGPSYPPRAARDDDPGRHRRRPAHDPRRIPPAGAVRG